MLGPVWVNIRSPGAKGQVTECSCKLAGVGGGEGHPPFWCQAMYALESVGQRQTSRALQNLFTGNEKENNTEMDY